MGQTIPAMAGKFDPNNAQNLMEVRLNDSFIIIPNTHLFVVDREAVSISALHSCG